MTLADDDLEIKKSETLAEKLNEITTQTKLAWYKQGFADGSGTMDNFVSNLMWFMENRLEMIAQRYKAETQPELSLTPLTQKEMKYYYESLTQLGQALYGNLTAPIMPNAYEAELRAFAGRYLVLCVKFLKLVDYNPEHYLLVTNRCRKTIPYDLFMVATRRGVIGEMLPAHIQALITEITTNKSWGRYFIQAEWNKARENSPELTKCLCSRCAVCCGAVCSCRFDHETEYECAEYENDPDECADDDHYSCYNCSDECACSNCH